ncbi:hypothetical protein BU16DRAFT_83657 [Lophium mytilinum]|uniref:N-acetyltransferase domain-containing protein n=1 Tax=Lophium mytilinum TaxID=390894 RepID=A0A6A6QMF5_9PEZI|nr:hypothetical protein BU16DRAFT_83657 [Lophium mytilinum]
MASVTPNSEYIVRPAKSLEEARDFWWPQMQKLQWSRDFNDGQTHYTVAGKEGWLVVQSRDDETAEGCIVPFVYANSTGWVGFFIVNEQHRGKGWGAALFRSLLKFYADHNTGIVGLDGVAEQVPTYERRGFVTKCPLVLMVRPSASEAPLSKAVFEPEEGEKLVNLREVPQKLLVESDLAHTGFERPKLWSDEALFSRPDVYGYALVSSTDANKLLGWVMVRRMEHGHRFGPLLADLYKQASVLLNKAMQDIESSKGSMVAEIFSPNPEGRKVFEELGWVWGGVDYHRMWLNGKAPKEQDVGGRGEKGMFAIFDAAEG